MYLPKPHHEQRQEILHAFIKANPLGALVSVQDNHLAADHIPFMLCETSNGDTTLAGHVARANPVWQALAGASEVLVIFQEGSAYISPGWYPSKAEHGKVVPTWNYAAVHAYGRPKLHHSAAWLRAHLQALVSAHEATQAVPWQLEDAPVEFIEQLLGQIVGVELVIDRLEGKMKLSQNRPRADQVATRDALRNSGNCVTHQLVERMTRNLGDGHTSD